MKKLTSIFSFFLCWIMASGQSGNLRIAENEIRVNLNGQGSFSLPINPSFLEVSSVRKKIASKMGSFKFNYNEEKTCNRLENINLIEKDGVFLISGKLQGKNCACDFRMDFTPVGENEMSFEISLSDSTFNKINFRFKSHTGECFYGFGEQYSHLNFKGHKFSVFSEEQGIGRGDKGITGLANIVGAGGNEFTSYAPIPFFITSEKRAMLIENPEFIEYDLRENDFAEVSVWNNHLKGRIWNDEPICILESYSENIGRMPELPDWAFGTWLGLQGGAEKVKRIVRETKATGNPVSAIWIQDWVGKRRTAIGSRLWWRWLPDTTNYPDIKNFCSEMNLQGVRVLGYINSFLADEGPMFEEARHKGFLVKNKKNEDYKIAAGGFDAYLVDLSNPEAFEWMKSIIKTNLIENGFSGWMADFAEWLPVDSKLFSGEDALSYHNKYPVEWVRLNREAIEESGNANELVFFNRSGFTGSANYSKLFWAGDQAVNWGKNDGLPSAINALISSGLSGIALNHSDIGGYTSINFPFKKVFRDRELFYRWAEMAAFTTVFRTHEGLNPEKDFQFYNDKEGQEFFARMGKLHFALKEYFQFLNKEATEKGLPVIRSPWLLYPDDENTKNLQYQFFVGNDLLVLPVIEKNIEEVNGYFPEGNWENIWTGEIIEGKKFFSVKAPLGQPAAFLKVNGMWSQRIKDALKELK